MKALDAYEQGEHFGRAKAVCERLIAGFARAGKRLKAAHISMRLGSLGEKAQRPLDEQAEAFIRAALIYLKKGEHEKAADAFARANGAGPARLVAAQHYAQVNRFDVGGQVYARLGMFAQAAQSYARARTQATNALSRNAFNVKVKEMDGRAGAHGDKFDRNL